MKKDYETMVLICKLIIEVDSFKNMVDGGGGRYNQDKGLYERVPDYLGRGFIDLRDKYKSVQFSLDRLFEHGVIMEKVYSPSTN